MSERKKLDAILLGIVGAFFFAFTFILNRSMSLGGGGYWMYSAILRYVFTLPILFAAVEATQCGEVVFTLLLGIVILRDDAPSLTGWIGIAVIVLGMLLTSLVKDEKE